MNVLETPGLRELYRRARCVFFDCDGVIFDSNTFKIVAMRRTIEEFAPAEVDAMEAHWRANGGASRFVKFEHFFTRIAPRDNVAERVQAASARFGQLAREAYEDAQPIPAALALARDAGASRCHVVSGATQDEILSVFESKGLTHLFASLQGSPRPKRALVEKVLAEQRCAAEDSLLIGDGSMDFRVSQELGIHFIFLAEYSDWSGAPSALAGARGVSFARSWTDLTRALLG